MMSLPPTPSMRSLPPNPQMTSWPSVPISVSLPAVPTTVQRLIAPACRSGPACAPRASTARHMKRSAVAALTGFVSIVRNGVAATPWSTRCGAQASNASPFRVVADLRAEHGPPRAGEEPGLEQERHHFGLADGAGVEALDREPLRAASPDEFDERRQRRTQPGLVRLA